MGSWWDSGTSRTPKTTDITGVGSHGSPQTLTLLILRDSWDSWDFEIPQTPETPNTLNWGYREARESLNLWSLRSLGSLGVSGVPGPWTVLRQSPNRGGNFSIVLPLGNGAQKRRNWGLLPNQKKNGVKTYFRKDINTILFPFFVRPSLSQLKVILHWDLEVWSQGTTTPQNKNYMQSIKFTTSDGQMHGPFGKIFYAFMEPMNLVLFCRTSKWRFARMTEKVPMMIMMIAIIIMILIMVILMKIMTKMTKKHTNIMTFHQRCTNFKDFRWWKRANKFGHG